VKRLAAIAVMAVVCWVLVIPAALAAVWVLACLGVYVP
jgi:hypothetical protein